MPYYRTFLPDTFINIEADSGKEACEKAALLIIEDLRKCAEDRLIAWEISAEEYK